MYIYIYICIHTHDYTYMCKYTYIYMYIIFILTCIQRAMSILLRVWRTLVRVWHVTRCRGNHLSNTTCPAQVFFKHGKYFC